MILKGLGMLLGYAVTILISREFGPVGLGIYSVSYTTIIVFSHVASLGLPVAILRYTGQFRGTNDLGKRKTLYYNALKIIFAISVVLSCALFAFAKDLGINLFGDPSYSYVLRWVAIAAPFFTLNVINVEFLRALERITLSEVFRTVFISSSILLILYVSDDSSQYLPVMALSIGILGAAVLSTGRSLSEVWKLEAPKGITFPIKEILNTGTPLMLVALGSYFLGNISVYLIQIFEDTRQVGIFSLSLKLTLLINFALIAITTVIAPKMSGLFWDGKKVELTAFVQKATKYVFLLSLPTFLVLVIFPGTVLKLIEPEFASGKYVMIFLALGQIFNAFGGPVSLLLNMSGHQKSVMKVILFVLVFAVSANIVLISYFGIMGAAIATALSIG
ncbi:flippase, partial [Robiginitalea sp.]|uniref:flippase n=1 Tax=Robiginitalea sp. TaxID=1902411 RepID=UPI003C3F97E2